MITYTKPAEISAGDFFEILYGEEAPGYLVLWTLVSNDKDSIKTFVGAAQNVRGAGNLAIRMIAERNVHFGIGLQQNKLTNNARGSADTVIAIPGLWLDIDIAGPAHKADNLPPDMTAAHELLAKLPLAPTMLVHSGNGIHAWWLFKELWVFDDAGERQQAMELVHRFQMRFITWAKERGWKMDNTSDLARGLRPPGTWNHKSNPPKLVCVLEHNEANRYDPSEFEPYLLGIDAPTQAQTEELGANVDYPPADITPIATGCAWLRHCQTDAVKLPEPEWYAMLSILARCNDGEKLACEWSRDYPGFSMRETLAKLNQAKDTAGPRTCEDIYGKGGMEYCEKCPNRGNITSPIVLGLPKQPTLTNPNKLPEIDAGNMSLPKVTNAAWEAVKKANDPPTLFQRGGLITRIQKGDHHEPYLVALTEDAIRGHIARIAVWFRWQNKGKDWEKIPALPPPHVVKDMKTTPALPLPVIARVVEAPVFGIDGSIEITPGYHESSRTYFWDSGLRVSDIPETPTSSDIAKAKALLLDELLGDFPFASPSEQAHALGAVLLPFARELITGPTPLHMIEAPSPGTGKSLLADAVAIPSTGRPAGTMTEGRDEDEWRKRITAMLMTAPTIISIDNVRRKLDSAALSAALTSTQWKDRVLGASSITTLPVRCIWLATANNPALTTEIARRIVRIRLDAKVSRPWQREGFRHNDLRSWALKHRAELVWAALTLIQAWITAGRPAGNYVLGQYESWAQTIGGIMDVCDITGFMGNADELYEAADEETEQWEHFISSWWGHWQNQPVTVRELYEIADNQDLLLSVRGNGNETSQKIRMGKAIKQIRDRIIGGYKLETAGRMTRNNATMYRLTQVDAPTVVDDAPSVDANSPFA